MDELKNLWAEMDANFEGPKITQQQLELKSRVDTPINKLKTNFMINLGLYCLSTLIMAVLFVWADGFWVRLLIGTIVIGYVVATWQTTYLYNRYLKNLYPDDDIKNYLSNLHKSIKEGLKYQEIVGLFFYPVALAAGYFLSLYQQGKTDTFFTDPVVWGALIAIIIVLTPLLFLLSRWLYNITFRKYLNQIESVLNELEMETNNEQ